MTRFRVIKTIRCDGRADGYREHIEQCMREDLARKLMEELPTNGDTMMVSVRRDEQPARGSYVGMPEPVVESLMCLGFVTATSRSTFELTDAGLQALISLAPPIDQPDWRPTETIPEDFYA